MDQGKAEDVKPCVPIQNCFVVHFEFSFSSPFIKWERTFVISFTLALSHSLDCKFSRSGCVIYKLLVQQEV